MVDIRILETNTTILKKFFAKNEWEMFLRYKEIIKQDAVWHCELCESSILGNDATVRCDHCLHWLHMSCINYITKLPNVFICSICQS